MRQDRKLFNDPLPAAPEKPGANIPLDADDVRTAIVEWIAAQYSIGVQPSAVTIGVDRGQYDELFCTGATIEITRDQLRNLGKR